MTESPSPGASTIAGVLLHPDRPALFLAPQEARLAPRIGLLLADQDALEGLNARDIATPRAPNLYMSASVVRKRGGW